MLANPEERGDQAARKTLVSIGPAAVASVEPLLHSERGALIQAALDVLRRLGPESIPALPAVLALALNEEGDWRVPALDSLGAMGSAAKEVQTPLRALRKSRQKEVSNAAKRALSEIRDG